jgi:kynurenine formamidase
LSLGTQTGTHIDAPGHFLKDAPTLDAIPPENLIGRYVLIDLPSEVNTEGIRASLERFSGQTIAFLRTPENGASRISREGLDILLSLPAAVFVLSGEIEVAGAQPFEFHRLIARAGKFLVEDLDQKAARAVPREGEIFALPLRLVGTSGSPCRVMVRTRLSSIVQNGERR